MVEYFGVYTRLTGRTLGIFYWTAFVILYIRECAYIIAFHARYLLDQGINTTEQVQVVKTILCCLLSMLEAVSLASEKIISLYHILLVEKDFLKQPICPFCQRMRCQRENLNSMVSDETAWLRTI